jgi:hypothetical protein
MLKAFVRLGFLFLVAASWALGQETSALVGTWAGKVQGYGVEMKLVLNADGTADFEGVAGRWRVQGTKLLLTQEEETMAYDFKLQGSQLTLSGGDLMAPLALSRAGSAGPASAGAAPAVQEPEESYEAPEPAAQDASEASEAKPPAAATRPAAGKRGLAESEVMVLLEAGVPPRRLIDMVGERGVAFAVTPAVVSRLKAKGATDELLAALRSTGGTQRAAGPSAAAAPPAQRSAAARAPARGSPGATRGSRYNQEKWGLSFAVPPNWKVGERGGTLLLGSGSGTEPGLMIIRFMRRTNLQTLAEGYQEGMQEEGLQLMPVSQLENFSAGGAQGLAGEMAGIAQDGARIRARALGVQSPFGDAAVVFGLTTEEKYPGLKPRVDSLASSFSFTQPQTPPVNEAVAGQYAYFYSSSVGGSYSRQDILNLCSDGSFNRGGEIYSSGDAGTAAGQSGNAGQWSAEGGDYQGTIVLTYDSGQTQQIQYQKSGVDIVLDGKKYGRFGDGSCTQRSPFE